MSVSSIRLPGLSTGMDTEQMVKNMLTTEQNKIDKAKQEKEKIGWQQEIYREVINEIKDLDAKYFDVLSPDYIGNKQAFSTTTITSTNSGVVSAIANSTNSEIDYSFKVTQVATTATMTTKEALNGKKLTLGATLGDLGLQKETTFKFKVENNGVASETKEIKIDKTTTMEELTQKIQEASGGKITLSFSEMDGSLKIKTIETGTTSTLSIENTETGTTDALSFLGLDGNTVTGINSKVEIMDSKGVLLRTEENAKNAFTIDDVVYSVNGLGDASLKGSVATAPVVDKMKEYVKEYNKIIDKVYGLVTQKVDNDYQPLTEEQKEEMTEKQIEVWEKKAKEGILRNDNEMRRFLTDLEGAINSNLSKYGITSSSDFSKRGQIAVDEKKFVEALKTNSKGLSDILVSTMNNTKKVIDNYIGTSKSVFIQKAGKDNSSTVVNNVLTEQIKRQDEKISELLRKFTTKEDLLYAKFALLESNMSKLNSQMSYLMQ